MGEKELQTNRDPLTGLLDRSSLDDIQKRFMHRDQQWSLVMLDVDHFKLVNDIYGHLTGDDIISHVGQTIRVNMKRNDYALRYGGDEFLLVLPDTSGNGALDLAQRLLFELGNREFPGGLRISASMGVAQSDPDDTELTAVLSRADQALYRAKETGRGRFVLSDSLGSRSGMNPDFNHMVGRREELQLLREQLDSISGGSAFCSLTGYQGMGKTRLVTELEYYCQFRQIQLLRIDIHPVREERGFLAVTAARKALGTLNEAELDRLSAEISPLEISTVEHLGEYGFSIKKRSVPADSDESWIRCRKDLGRILLSVSGIRPFALVLDNLQNASADCVRYMNEVLMEIPGASILTIAAGREGHWLQEFGPLVRKQGSLSLHLEPLSRSDVRTMLFFALKSPGVPADALDYMMNQSGGNTLFLRKLIEWCIASGSLEIGEGDACSWVEPPEEELPSEITGIVEGMLQRYGPEEIKVLKRAALAGTSLNLKMLGRLTGMSEFTLAEIMDGFAGNGLIRDLGETYGFTFGVMRSYLVSRITPSLRSILHEKAALALEETGEGPIERRLTDIAAHYCGSRNQPKALEYAGLAAKSTFAAGLHSQSIHWYREYIKRLSRTGDPKEFFRASLNLGVLFSITGRAEDAQEHMNTALDMAEDPVDICAVHYRLGDNCRRKSDYPAALEHYQKAVSIGRAAGNTSPVLLNNIIGALIEYSFISRLQGRLDEAGEKLQEAGAIMNASEGGFDPTLEGLYYARLADLESDSGSRRKAMEYYRNGLDIAISHNDHNGEALILNNMHGLFALSGDYEAMLDTLKQVVRLNTKLDDQLGLAIAYYNLAESYCSLNMLDLARRYFQLYIELNSRIHNRLGMGYGQLGLGKLLALEGRLDKAAQYLLNASEIFQELDCIEMMCEARLETAMVMVSASEFKEAVKILDEIEELCTGRDFCNRATHIRGYILVLSGESVDRGIFMVESSIRNAEELTPFDVAHMYGNLYRAYMSAGSEEQALHALSNGVEVLQTTISQIGTESMRNSILSRKDVADYLTLCEEQGVALGI